MINLVIITGISGSGKSTALKAFEDLGYLAIDNFPIRLLFAFLEEIKESLENREVALVMDLRDKYFLSEYSKTFQKLKEKGYSFEIIFLDAQTEVLINRFNQTRRPHPLIKKEHSLLSAIEAERELLLPLKNISTIILDTTFYNIHQLREEIFKIYKNRKNLSQMVVSLISFGYKYGIPYDVNYLFDIRFLPNPYFVPELKPLVGTEKEIREYLKRFESYQQFLKELTEFLKWIIEKHIEEGRRYISIGVGCTGGRHRGPAVVEDLTESLKSRFFNNIEIVKIHRDINRDV